MIQPQDINILIACEESQAETIAFREMGFNAFSCDIQPARRGTPKEWHIIQDVTPLLLGETRFTTEDGTQHVLSRWHFILSHPPCTYLCKVGSVRLVQHTPNGIIINQQRMKQMQDAADFFRICLNAKADYVAVENPIPMRRAGLPRPSCFACPSWFGVKYTKKTLYWTRNLPPLMAEIDYPNPKEFMRASRGKYRSRTFPQLARAIARQWGGYILDDLNSNPR